jgi:hypothetical protein
MCVCVCILFISSFHHVKGVCLYEDLVILFDLVLQYLLQYIKHLAFNTAKHGWNVVISNHRGLGGVSITVSFSSSFLFILFFFIF